MELRMFGIVGAALVLLSARPAPAQEPTGGAAAVHEESAAFRGNASRTGEFAGPGPARGAEVGWRFETGGTVRSTPAVDAAAAYAGSGDGQLYAVDLDNGSLRWRYDAGDPVIGSPALSADLVVATTRNGSVHAVSRSSGRLAWSHPGSEATVLTGGWDYYASSPVVV